MNANYFQRISVSFDYPVLFDRDVFAIGNPLLVETLDRLRENRRHRALCFVDSGVAATHPRIVARISEYAAAHADRMELVLPPRVVPGGETIKNNYRLSMEIVDTILQGGLCRHSFVIAVGGGAVLDAVGFAASIVHRGLRMLRLPTTVLAQNDAGVGVKNAMNLHGGKNTIGTFSPPFAVINDAAFLASLPDAEWRAGISEAFKVAMIKDARFFRDLCRDAAALRARNAAAMEALIERCARLHLDHLRESGDPFELGSARPLDFGHWSAHKLESLSAYRISHGDAVATGIALDSYYAWRRGWLAESDFQAAIRSLRVCGFPLWHPELDERMGDGRLRILQGLDEFREHLGGRLCVTCPDGIGARREDHEVEAGLIEEAVAYLRGISSAVPAA